MNSITNIFKYLISLAGYVVTGPRINWLLFFMLLGVYHVPINHSLHAILHLDNPNVTMFFPWPEPNNILLFIHITAAIPATFLGPLLFITAYRKAYPSHHRWIGKIYAYGCIISAITIFPLALANRSGFVPHLGFGVMSICWFFITYWAYTSARRKDFVAHRRWMFRSYAMTFAFVHVNFTYSIMGFYYYFDITGIKIFQSMLSWMFNLFVVEIYLSATAVNGRWLGFKKMFYNLTHWSPADKFYWVAQKHKNVATA